MRNTNIDVLRFLSAIAIIFIHVNTDYIDISTGNLLFKNFIEYGLRFSVPLFFLISGYLFYSSRNKERIIVKNLIIYLSISLLYIFLNSVLKFLNLNYEISNIFWFFKVLILLEILYLRDSKSKTIFLIIISIILNFIFDFKLEIINLLLPFIPIFSIGIYLKKENMNFLKKQNNKIIFVTILIMLTLNVLYFNLGQYNYYNHIIAVLIFLFSINIPYKMKERKLYLKSLDLYLFHPIIICSVQYIILRSSITKSLVNYYPLLISSIVFMTVFLILLIGFILDFIKRGKHEKKISCNVCF